MTYSLDFRKRVLSVREAEGLSFAKVASHFGVCAQSVYRWSKKIGFKRKRNKPATKIDMEGLKKDVLEHPDAYHHERAKRLKVSVRCVGYALKRLGVSYKKNAEAPQGVRRQTACLPGENKRVSEQL